MAEKSIVSICSIALPINETLFSRTCGEFSHRDVLLALTNKERSLEPVIPKLYSGLQIIISLYDQDSTVLFHGSNHADGERIHVSDRFTNNQSACCTSFQAAGLKCHIAAWTNPR